MTHSEIFTAIGLMSGTSLDGIDAAVIRTDGRDMVEPLGFVSLPYDPDLQLNLRAVLGAREDTDGRIAGMGEDIARASADVVREVMAEAELDKEQVDVIGFHGQTITHAPDAHFTWQIGDADMLARELGMDVIHDFRSADVAAGGQGAPLVPLYHRARAVSADLPRPLAILNIGGVANVTWIGEGEEDIIAFDTGPGNALIDDFVYKAAGQPFDRDGDLGFRGNIHQDVLGQLLASPYFKAPPPKSLDRNAWPLQPAMSLSAQDGAATLAAFTAFAVDRARDHFPAAPKQWIVCGGGRKNLFLMKYLADLLGVPVDPVEQTGWNGDALEAEAFGWLAVRHLLGLPLSLPSTTGVPEPMPGGKLIKAR